MIEMYVRTHLFYMEFSSLFVFLIFFSSNIFLACWDNTVFAQKQHNCHMSVYR